MVQRILAPLNTVTIHLQLIFNEEITTIHNGVTLPKSHTLRSAILLDSAARMRTARALELSTQLRVTFMVIFLVILWEVPGIPASKMVILWWKYSMHTVSGTFCQTGSTLGESSALLPTAPNKKWTLTTLSLDLWTLLISLILTFLGGSTSLPLPRQLEVTRVRLGLPISSITALWPYLLLNGKLGNEHVWAQDPLHFPLFHSSIGTTVRQLLMGLHICRGDNLHSKSSKDEGTKWAPKRSNNEIMRRYAYLEFVLWKRLHSG